MVDYLLHYVNAATPWWRDFPGWFFQVDLERWEYDNVSTATGIEFADLLVKRTDRVALLYASKGMYGNSFSSARHPLWNARYGPKRSIIANATQVTLVKVGLPTLEKHLSLAV